MTTKTTTKLITGDVLKAFSIELDVPEGTTDEQLQELVEAALYDRGDVFKTDGVRIDEVVDADEPGGAR